MYRAEPFVVCPDCEPGEPTDEAIAAAKAMRDSVLLAGEPATATRTGEIAGADQHIETEPVIHDEYNTTLSLEQMAELGESYQPDATLAADLFAGVKVANRIITPQIAFLIQDAMREVIRRGTGVRANALGRRDLSGKTGTSNDRRDAWFAGFNSKTVGIVWVGYDDSLPLGPTRGGIAHRPADLD